MSINTIVNYNYSQSSKSTDLPDPKSSRPTVSSTTLPTSSAPTSSSKAPSLLTIPTECFIKIISISGSIMPIQTCSYLKKFENQVYAHLYIDIEKSYKPLQFSLIKKNAGITSEDLVKVQFVKLASHHTAELIQNWADGLESLQNSNLIPVISPSRFRKASLWIWDEKFLKICNNYLGSGDELMTISTSSHAEKAVHMRKWIVGKTEQVH